MLDRVANWHGEQAAIFYQRWDRTQSEDDLRNYCRHASISKALWNVLRTKKK